MAKKGSNLTLFELMHAAESRRKRFLPWRRKSQQVLACNVQTVGQAKPQQVDSAGTALTVRLSPAGLVVACGLAAAALLTAFALGRLTAGRGSQPAPPTGPAAQELQIPLPSLVPAEDPGRPQPDSPVLEGQTPAGPQGTAVPPQTAAAGLGTTGSAAAAGRQTVARPQVRMLEDPRRIGMTYLVVQNFKRGAFDDALEVQRFLASQGIPTVIVPGARGGWKLVSRQGFDLRKAADKKEFERLRRAVREAGKLYSSRRYRGRYNFSDCYGEKFLGR